MHYRSWLRRAARCVCPVKSKRLSIICHHPVLPALVHALQVACMHLQHLSCTYAAALADTEPVVVCSVCFLQMEPLWWALQAPPLGHGSLASRQQSPQPRQAQSPRTEPLAASSHRRHQQTKMLPGQQRQQQTLAAVGLAWLGLAALPACHISHPSHQRLAQGQEQLWTLAHQAQHQATGSSSTSSSRARQQPSRRS